MIYRETEAEKRVKAYTDPAYTRMLADKRKKGFMVAAQYCGLSIAMFILSFVAPDMPWTDQDKEVLGVLRLFAMALAFSGAALLIALLYARDFLGPLLFVLNWIILPFVAIDGLLTLAGIFFVKPEIS